ncbi:MAG: gamma-glutamyl-gamma-aminobutyrate hydrolase family protein [Alphaproteobacteria bacterium]|jgi:putative glutamine amidotransferase|nr:gamma-glutamyl-gamma-aminobutyrate hydrolase family protein [Alphaproteobacteria bacterium]MDP6872999.1 gamma-glutamyl-gamma-aminobutyrate hydrolase family protein [Alphaproteobacteria bacterium]
MQRIGITQRVEAIRGRGERRDALDQRWQAFFTTLGVLAVPLPNSAPSAELLLDELGLAGILLSGGNDVAETPEAMNVAPERDRLERDLIRVCLARGVPLLGVCRGMQMINVALGGYLARTTGHAGVEHLIAVADCAHWPDGWRVNSYHDVCVPDTGLAPELRSLAKAPNGDVEAFSHMRAKCHGIMWHPERETPPRAEDLAFISHVLEL